MTNVATRTKLSFPLQQTFFGLSPEYMENVYEQFFVLKYHGGWSFTEAYSLPIKLREWFLKRLIEQKQQEQEAVEEVSSTSRATKTVLGPGINPPKL